MSILKTLNHLYSNFLMEFLNDPSLVLYSSSYTPLNIDEVKSIIYFICTTYTLLWSLYSLFCFQFIALLCTDVYYLLYSCYNYVMSYLC